MKISDAGRRLLAVAQAHDAGWRCGVTVVAATHPMVIEAAMREAAAIDQDVFIETSAYRVNQSGGYSGMTPDDFRAHVLDIAETLSFPFDRIVLAGATLGPGPWRNETSENALDRAADMVRAYARAGFGLLHLDAATPCAGDPVPLPTALVAKRAARLAKAVEDTVKELGLDRPVFLLGSEAPAAPGDDGPGSARQLDETLRLHREAFGAQGLEEAFSRTVALMAHAGHGYDQSNVHAADAGVLGALAGWRDRTTGMVMAAPATDHQDVASLRALVRGGFAVLKVGPGLSFAMREALYGLDLVAAHYSNYRATSLHAAMEAALQSAPANWQPYVSGSAAEQSVQRHYGFADRIRFYWTHPRAVAAVDDLFAALDGVEIALPLISQYLPGLTAAVRTGRVAPTARALVIAHIRATLASYSAACAGAQTERKMPTIGVGRSEFGSGVAQEPAPV